MTTNQCFYVTLNYNICMHFSEQIPFSGLVVNNGSKLATSEGIKKTEYPKLEPDRTSLPCLEAISGMW